MKLINRSKQSPVGRRACDVALAAHHEKFGDYGRQNYTVVVDGVKVPVEIVNRPTSYVATAMIGVRKLRNLPAQAN
ncbi:DUF4060 family protein [Salmonella enterica]|uniref:DUF4060 family protein n=1 Tax=Salmonella enterica TaxID=28901 RepID=A0A5Y9Y9S7_SALER|nr:DUF4060 family protein [Salmonella enterica]EDX7312934.1 DUF4060 family protein [Salmonella enterica subsp. enterica serovar Alabama]EDZ2953159.1 DUF4060 family protein [Salmonella enterica]EEM7298049.1 DUF4060 family protein [Salmonella enterica]EGF3848790.1 DUF4060 family protein [Salmonella enterica]